MNRLMLFSLLFFSVSASFAMQHVKKTITPAQAKKALERMLMEIAERKAIDPLDGITIAMLQARAEGKDVKEECKIQ